VYPSLRGLAAPPRPRVGSRALAKKEADMRTLLITLGGFALGALCLGLAALLAPGRSATLTAATAGFVVMWFALAAANLWAGVSRAGYAFREELPIFLLIFLLPALAAVLVRWKLL
jgi:hypothetical protein